MTHEACAHCGRGAELIVINKITGVGYVRCTNMDCRMETPIAKTEAEAWAIWDRRIEGAILKRDTRQMNEEAQ